MAEKYRGCNNCRYNSVSMTDEPCTKCINHVGDDVMWRPKENDETPKTRADFLKEVDGIICKDRNEQYGEPEDNFKRIAVFWSNYLDKEITSADVAIMMVLFKAARIATGHNKEDNWIDLIGYGACGAECAAKEVK